MKTCSLRTFQIPRFAKCDGFTVPVKIALGLLESRRQGALTRGGVVGNGGGSGVVGADVINAADY